MGLVEMIEGFEPSSNIFYISLDKLFCPWKPREINSQLITFNDRKSQWDQHITNWWWWWWWWDSPWSMDRSTREDPPLVEEN